MGASPGAESGVEIRVAVVEEREVFRRGLVACLADDRSLEVTVTKADALPEQTVDIAVVSSAAARSHPFPCPIVVCGDDSDLALDHPAGNDVAGVLHRGSLTEAQLLATVHAAAVGLRVNADASSHRAGELLEPRAIRLLELLADGHSTREIADRMGYSERTIKKLIAELANRLQARSRAQIVAQAMRRGLI
jgi:DNA-binding NarL/FixJ family response regulator